VASLVPCAFSSIRYHRESISSRSGGVRGTGFQLRSSGGRFAAFLVDVQSSVPRFCRWFHSFFSRRLLKAGFRLDDCGGLIAGLVMCYEADLTGNRVCERICGSVFFMAMIMMCCFRGNYLVQKWTNLFVLNVICQRTERVVTPCWLLHFCADFISMSELQNRMRSLICDWNVLGLV
jgi:hypothetical protein